MSTAQRKAVRARPKAAVAFRFDTGREGFGEAPETEVGLVVVNARVGKRVHRIERVEGLCHHLSPRGLAFLRIECGWRHEKRMFNVFRHGSSLVVTRSQPGAERRRVAVVQLEPRTALEILQPDTLIPTGPSHATPSDLPGPCRKACASPFGTPLGAADGTVAYSNCNAGCIASLAHHIRLGPQEATYTGMKWQCVEYARRWWAAQRGAVFPSVDTADAMWTEVRSATRVGGSGSDIVVEVTAHENGADVPPEAGDLLIYRADPGNPRLRFGHVAVVVQSHPEEGSLSIAEQNFFNKPWKNTRAFARKLRVTRETLVVDPDLEGAAEPSSESKGHVYGWLRLRPDRPLEAPDKTPPTRQPSTKETL